MLKDITLNSIGGNLMTLQELNVVISAETSGLKKALKGAEGQVDKFGNSVKSINQVFSDLADKAEASMREVGESIDRAMRSYQSKLKKYSADNEKTNPFKINQQEIAQQTKEVEDRLETLKSQLNELTGSGKFFTPTDADQYAKLTGEIAALNEQYSDLLAKSVAISSFWGEEV